MPTDRLYPPGESPFHVRGSTYVGIRRYIDTHIRGGLAAVLERLPDEPHRAFASQVFLPVSFYDALPIRTFSAAVAEVEGRPYADSVQSRAALIARRDLSGLYKLLLMVASPEFVIERLQRALLRYFDFGHLEVIGTTRGRSEGRATGLPASLGPWFGPMATGYATAVLAAAGAASPRVRVSSPSPDGERFGVQLVALRLNFTWS